MGKIFIKFMTAETAPVLGGPGFGSDSTGSVPPKLLLKFVKKTNSSVEIIYLDLRKDM